VFTEEESLEKKMDSHVSILNPQRQICGRRTFDKRSSYQIKFSHLNQNLMVRIAYVAISNRMTLSNACEAPERQCKRVKGRLMPKHIVTLLMAATLAGCLFTSEAQARGGGHLGGRNGAQVGDFHEMHIPGVERDGRMGADSGSIRMSSFGREIHSERRHGDHRFCHPDCGLYGCRYLWQYSCL